MFVVYQNSDEVLVTTRKRESQFLKDWFENTGRDLEDYNRQETKDTGVRISHDLHTSV